MATRAALKAGAKRCAASDRLFKVIAEGQALGVSETWMLVRALERAAIRVGEQRERDRKRRPQGRK